MSINSKVLSGVSDVSSEIALKHNFLASDIDIQIRTAKSYPRDLNRFIEYSKETVTMDEELALSCFYARPVTGIANEVITNQQKINYIKARPSNIIVGNSIRFAELLLQNWGNCKAAQRAAFADKYVTGMASIWDMEQNIHITCEFTKNIFGKNGKYSENLQQVTANAACAIAFRNTVFKIIPIAFVNIIASAAKKYLTDGLAHPEKRVQAQTTLQQEFSRFGIKKEKILQFYDCESLRDINAEQILECRALLNQIKDGVIKPEEAFAVAECSPTPYSSAEDNLKKLFAVDTQQPAQN